MQLLHIPDPSLVLLVGASGSGKSSMASRHFGRHEVISSDQCRAMICDDEADQSVTADTFELLRTILSMRLAHNRLSVIDATNVERNARLRSIEVARIYSMPVIAIVFRVAPQVCIARNTGRVGRVVPESVIRQQWNNLHQSIGSMDSEGYACIYDLDVTTIDNIRIIRHPRDSAS
jgi:protein phosphatase